jgi:hypothetical protein
MILDMIVWGFFSAWGWIGANAIKEKVWPETPPAIVQPVEKQDATRNEESKKSGS